MGARPQLQRSIMQGRRRMPSEATGGVVSPLLGLGIAHSVPVDLNTPNTTTQTQYTGAAFFYQKM
jgi:hypothetical protein